MFKTNLIIGNLEPKEQKAVIDKLYKHLGYSDRADIQGYRSIGVTIYSEKDFRLVSDLCDKYQIVTM
jgi:hypothetical protein